MGRNLRAALLAPPALACGSYLVIPQASVAQVLTYQVVMVWCLLAAALGVVLNRPARLGLWICYLAGFLCWVAGDAAWAWAQWISHTEPFPSVADVFFLAGYAVFSAFLLGLIRTRHPGRDRAALLDAAVLTIGVGVLGGVFVVLPLAADSTQSILGRVVGSAYPLGDVLLLGMLARLMSSSGSVTTAYRLLVAAVALSLLSDTAYDVITLRSDGSSTPRWVDAGWLLLYVLLAATVTHPSMRQLSDVTPVREETLTNRRLVLLWAACALAPATLLAQFALAKSLSVLICVAGSLMMSGLVLTRMAGLISRVRAQATQLAELAALDGLTSLGNRRTWDLELSRACRDAAQGGGPLAVAILDLDHFKLYNDEFGHQAGDALLQEASASWGGALRTHDVLARYGGEEFTVLMPGADLETAREAIERLRALTPGGQTFSAGVTGWGEGDDPAALVARADRALYAAKRAGRDRVLVASAHGYDGAEVLESVPA